MRKLAAIGLFAIGLGAANSGAWACPSVSLPTAIAGNSVTFGDAVSYSLPILGISVPSTPGQISNCIVIATGASGVGVNTNVAGADNAYQTPNGTNGDAPWFSTGNSATQPYNTLKNPNPTFTGQTTTTWDITASALQGFLNGGDLVVMFNHNQENSGGATNQNLFIWAQVGLVDTVTNTTQYFYASAEDNSTGLPNFGIPGGDPTTFTGTQAPAANTYPVGSDGGAGAVQGGFCGIPDAPACGTDGSYMINGQGRICLNGPVGVGVPIPCDGSGGTVVATVNDNLGADHVANAIVFPELNAILDNPDFVASDYVLQVDLRMGCDPSTITAINGPQSSSTAGCPDGAPLNNGFEQVFLSSTAPLPPVVVPEPSSLLLLGSALVALGAWSRRRYYGTI